MSSALFVVFLFYQECDPNLSLLSLINPCYGGNLDEVQESPMLTVVMERMPSLISTLSCDGIKYNVLFFISL